MGIQTFKGGFYFPSRFVQGTAAPAFSTIQMNTINERTSFVVQAPKSGNITSIGFSVGTKTGTTQPIDLRLEPIDTATGLPTTNLWGSNTNVSVVVGSGNTFYVASLTSPATVNKGDLLGIVIANPGASPPDFALNYLGGSFTSSYFPYVVNDTGTATKIAGSPITLIDYGVNDIEPIEDAYPFQNFSVVTFGSGSTPDEYALRFSPMPWTAQCTGFWVYGKLDGPAAVKLYNVTDNITLATLSSNPNIDQTQGVPGWGLRFYVFPTTPILHAGKIYHLGFAPLTTTTISLGITNVAANTYMDGMDGGQAIHLASRVDVGSWNTDLNGRILAGLTFSGIDTGNFVVSSPRRVR